MKLTRKQPSTFSVTSFYYEVDAILTPQEMYSKVKDK